jgi:hypothetical protein
LNGSELEWQANHLREILKQNVVNLVFIKKDGSERKMRCTLLEQFLPQQTDLEEAIERNSKKNNEVISVWDLEAEGWRSFRVDSILTYNV